jgi:SSS family solute:Na+ symporter
MLGVYSHFLVIAVGYVAGLFFPKPDRNKNLFIVGGRKRVEKKSKYRFFLFDDLSD